VADSAARMRQRLDSTARSPKPAPKTLRIAL
jgi:hypothetical protein